MDPAHIARLKEEQELAYQDTQAKIQQWKKFEDDYSSLQDRMKTLPDKVTHSVMVPFGPLAFMPGQIIHTNEILVLLGDNWFAERSAKQACEIVHRRKKQIQTTLTELEEQRRLLGDRLGFTTEFKELSENKDDIVEIKEEYDPEKEKIWREERKRKKQASSGQPKTARSRDSTKTNGSSKETRVAKTIDLREETTTSKDLTKTTDSKEETKTLKDLTKTASSKILPTSPHQGDQAERLIDTEVNTWKKNVDTASQGSAGSGQSTQVKPDEHQEPQGKREMMAAEEQLWARLDELERQEEELDELARMSDYEEDEEYENRPMFSFTQENTNAELPQKKTPRKEKLTRSNSGEKRVQWKDQQEVEVEASDGSSSSEEPEVPRPATIHFTHTNVNPQQETKQSEEDELISPADIYTQYLAKQPSSEDLKQCEKSSSQASPEVPLKSIMKPAHAMPELEPFVEKPAKQILPQPESVFSGNIVERQAIAMVTPAETQPMTDKPAKRVSKFKAARQQQKR